MYRLNHKLTGSFAAWVGVMAVVLNALWPLIAQLKPDIAAMQVEDCIESDVHHAEAADDRSAPDQPSTIMPRCAFCTLVAGGFTALIAYDVIIVGSIDTEESRLTLAEVRPIAFFSYSLAQPRAPPVLS